MTTPTVLILGLRHSVVDAAEEQLALELPGVHVHEGVTLADAQDLFARTTVDHVIIGAGFDLDTRLEIIRWIFETSDATTVHLKDRTSGPTGFLPFIRAVVHGLAELAA